MGEADRVVKFGPQARVNHNQPGQPGKPMQINIDLKDTIPRVCQNKISDTTETGVYEHICGCDIFIPAVKLYTVSALLSPTGKELTVQQPFLFCKNCGEAVIF